MDQQPDDAALQREFARRKNNQWTATLVAVPASVGGLFLALFVGKHVAAIASSPVLMPLLILSCVAPAIVGAVLYTSANWRCPACGKKLPSNRYGGGGRLYLPGAHCPHCTRQLSARG